jgi:hypothetical protein
MAGSPHSLVLRLHLLLPAARRQVCMLLWCLQEDLQLQPAVRLPCQRSADKVQWHRNGQTARLREKQAGAPDASAAATTAWYKRGA